MKLAQIGRMAFVSLILLTIFRAISTAEEHGFTPRNGYVPDEKTAISIAEAVLIPIYGEKQIASERPFHAKLNGRGVWTVEGFLPDGSDGGIAVVKLLRQDGRIVYVMHGK